MSWFDKQKEDSEYEVVGSIRGQIRASTGDIFSFTIDRQYSEANLRKAIGKMLKELDEEGWVDLEFRQNNDDRPRVYGGGRPTFDFWATFKVPTSDIPLLDGELPVKIKVETNVYPNYKDGFVAVFEQLYQLLS